MSPRKIEELLEGLEAPPLGNEAHRARLRDRLESALGERRGGRKARRGSGRIWIAAGAPVLALAAAAAFFLFVLPAARAPDLARLEGLGGRVTAGRGGKLVEIGEGRPISAKEGWTISAGKGQGFQLDIGEKSRLRAGPGTEIRLAALRGSRKDYITAVEIRKGSVDCRVKLPSPASRFEAIAPDAVIRVTGTVFSVSVAPNGDMELSMAEGETRVELRLSEGLSARPAGPPSFASRIDALSGDGIGVPAGGSLLLRHAEIAALAERISALLETDPESAEREIRECNESYRRIMRLKGAEAVLSDPTRDLSPSLAPALRRSAAPKPRYETEAWTRFAANDFSSTMTPENFNTFVRYAGDGLFSLRNGRCAYAGHLGGSSGSIYLSMPKTAPAAYRISLGLPARPTGTAKITAGIMIDGVERAYGEADADSLTVRGESGRLIASAPIKALDWREADMEVVMDAAAIRVRLIEKATGKVLAEAAGDHGLERLGEAFIRASGAGGLEFDDVSISTAE